jgi:hypothetical protein
VSALKCDKFYIIAMAASGKSTFTAENPTYNGYRVVDYAERLPSLSWSTNLVLYLSRFLRPLRKLVKHRPEMAARRQEHYFSQAFAYIINHKEPIVVFGRRPPCEFEELSVHDSIKFAMILIPEEDHRRNCASRKQELRNPLPFFHHWTTDFDKIGERRNSLTDYAKQHDIPVYESFTGAIDDMHERYALRP